MQRTLHYAALTTAVFALGFASAHVIDDSNDTSTHLPRIEPVVESTLTDSLTARLHAAWNNEDMPALMAMLQPTAFFKSPYQLRYGRDDMQGTVLVTNPPVFKVFESKERYSYVSENLAWSIGSIKSHVHDVEGNDTGEIGEADYIYVFTPDSIGAWRVQMMVYHE